MRTTARLASFLAVLALSWPAAAQVYPNIPANTFLGRLGAGQAGPPQPIPFATLFQGAANNIPMFSGAPGIFLDTGVNALRVPPTGVADPSTGIGGAGASGKTVARLDESWTQSGNYHFLQSTDDSIFPGQISIRGTWATGNIATVRLTWGGVDHDYSYTVGATTDNHTVASGLNAVMAADATLASLQIYIQAVFNSSGSNWDFQFVPHYAQYPVTISDHSTTASGSIVGAVSPVNLLADPVTIGIMRTVSGRTPQSGDYIGEFAFWAQDTSSPNMQLYARMQGYIDAPASAGRIQFQTFASDTNGVKNVLFLRHGAYLLDANGAVPTDGSTGDKGYGWFNVPVLGGYDLSGAGTLTNNGSGQVQLTALGTNAVNILTSNSAGNISLSPNSSTIETITPNGLVWIDGRVLPNADSTTAIRFQNHAQTSTVIDIDTSNKRVGINKTPGAFDLDVNGAANIGGALTLGTALTSSNINISNLSAALGGDVTLNNASNFFDGPSIAQGSTGTWSVRGSVALEDTGGTAIFECKLWDGTTVLDEQSISAAANILTHMSLGGIIASPAGNLKISCSDSLTTGKIVHLISSHASASISAFRLQ